MTPIMISIDVEPTHRLVKGGSGDWTGFPELLDLMTKKRAGLEAASGHPVHYTWNLRMDPQIQIAYGRVDWAFHRYGAEIARIRNAGDAVGLHVHTWRPTRRWFRDTWLAEFEDEDWIAHCLTLAMETFRDNVGAPPGSMSFGDNFMHPVAPPIMEAFGLRGDLSMNPGMTQDKVKKTELSNGRLPDYTDTPRHPFRPSTADFRVPGPTNYGFWELPVSSGVIGTHKDGSENWTKLLLGINPDRIRTIIPQALARPSPYLLAECRTDVLTHPKTRERFIWALDHLAEVARENDGQFLAIDGFCDLLDAGTFRPAA